jgi:hypothetical protein
MKAKFGAIVVAGSGKIGGHVASRNRAGSYFRTKVTPVNPSTSFQQGIRNRLAGISQAWKALTAAQRIAWNAAVGDYSKTDVFGDLRNPSGFNLFQRLNNNLLTIGESQISDPPVPGAVYSMTSMSLAVVTGSPALTLTFAGAIPATDAVKLFATAPVSQGVSFVKSEFRLIGILSNSDTSPKVITTLYGAKFGAVTENGLKVFVKAVPVNVATGQEGIGLVASAISVTA